MQQKKDDDLQEEVNLSEDELDRIIAEAELSETPIEGEEGGEQPDQLPEKEESGEESLEVSSSSSTEGSSLLEETESKAGMPMDASIEDIKEDLEEINKGVESDSSADLPLRNRRSVIYRGRSD